MTSRKDLIVHELKRIDGQAPNERPGLTKHQVMAANPFRFFRGSAQLFYADLASGQLILPQVLKDEAPLTTIIGDCHLSNFGFFTEEGAYGDSIIFAPNDFDDACMGLAAWDLVRFGVSLCLAAELGQGLIRGQYESDRVEDPEDYIAATVNEALEAVEDFINAYRMTCLVIADDSEHRLSALNSFSSDHVLSGHAKKALTRAAGERKFLKKSSLAKAVDLSADKLRFRDRSDRFKRLSKSDYQQIEHTFRPYVDDHILDIVERIGAGTGSVNMSRYYLLVGPKPDHGPNPYRGPEDLGLCYLVEIKQQREAAPIFFFPALSPNNRLDPAHLTVDCQRRMQRHPDIVLDDGIWQGKHWLIRSRHHARVSVAPEDIVLAKKTSAKKGKKSSGGSPAIALQEYAETCGQALALAHARGDRRSTRFERSMAKILKSQVDTLVDCCRLYHNQVLEDWQLLNDCLS